ncbi:OmpA family protein [Coleofasciculus sp. LEGE 07092]|uniref:OmpA family protein n=3 Tax=unclassified Coleofasciculus TaxID=2692782 RepID=UPI00188164CC|nr:OmpA family protein [Coleofasciculus sp. LEGE 07092]
MTLRQAQGGDAQSNASATTQPNNVVVVVNSNQDGEIQPDQGLTLREAIAIVNGELGVEQLSAAEKAQITPGNTTSRIEFNLPPDQTTIRLEEILPPLARPGLVVDGTTQPGYDATQSPTAEIAIPTPVVAIAPAPDRQILRGLTIVADNASVRGLSIYGFKTLRDATLSTPPADIFIAHASPPPDISEQYPPNRNFPFYESNVPPKNVTIEFNWLGITPDEEMPDSLSAFGVSVFNSVGTTIRRNRIANHEGSGIITSVRANTLLVTENIIVGNGIAGMPDAIRLEGIINASQITGNLICGNDGSGVYLFKPEGDVQIRDNQIVYNGRRLRRAAVYLMGDNHQVTGNQIGYQTGPGTVVAAYPNSLGNIIVSNSFGELDGLSIDLNTQQHVEPFHFQRGDGVNPPRKSRYQRSTERLRPELVEGSRRSRQTTGNAGINAPEFASREFVALGSQVEVFGQADPDSTVELYRVIENTAIPYGPLNVPLDTVATNEDGRFSAVFDTLQPGDRVSAIATHPQYGTSEPALNAMITSLDGSPLPAENPVTPVTPTPVIPQCTSQAEPPAPPEPPPPPPEPLTLRVPRNVHFALDRSDISPASAEVLDQIAAVLQQYPFLTIELQGHTDPRASAAYNQALAERRALSVRNYLLRQGIAPERMMIRSFGESQRRTMGDDPVDYARDRRVEIIFQDLRGLEIIFETQETDLQIESTGSDE